MIGKAAFVAIQTGRPTLLWGKPGVGKTSWIQMIAKATGVHLETVIASIREPSDFGGLPVIQEDGSIALAAPNWASRLIEAKRGLLFMDEISTAPPATQSALLRVVLERVVGDVRIPDDIWIAAAANPTDTSSGTWALSAALANRFIHIDWSLDAKTWVEGMIEGWKVATDLLMLPEDWKDGIKYSRSIFASFIQARPTLLLDEPENAEDAGKAWPSPRTWDMASEIYTASQAAGLDENGKITLLAGCVGDGPAAEFYTWMKNLDLPNPEDLLENPDILKKLDRDDQVFAVLSSIAAALSDNVNQKRWKSAWKVLGLAADEGYADVAAIPARTIAKIGLAKENLTMPDEVKAFVPILSKAGLIK